MYLLHLLLWWFAVPIFTTEHAAYIHCYDNLGNIPTGQGYDKESFTNCPDPYSITSCGVTQANDGDIELNYVYYTHSSGRCITATPGTIPNQVIARCCNLTDYGSSFRDVYSPRSTNTGTQSCSDTEEVVGCMIYMISGIFGGAFAGSLIDYDIANVSSVFNTENSCTAKTEASGGSLYAYAICYDSSSISDGYALNCVSIWGSKSDETGTTTSTASCPTDSKNYFMTSCSGYSPFGDVKSYRVINSVCTVTEKTNAGYVVANAICCRMTKNIEALNPTHNPTLYPTLDPVTSAPVTVDPTVHPTMHSSAEPTLNPTTFRPSSDPTLHPTMHPSLDPTLNPTFYRSSGPTFNPLDESATTFYPSTVPTANPTVYPIEQSEAGIDVDTTYAVSVQDKAKSENNPNKILLIAVSIVSVLIVLAILITIYICKWAKNDEAEAQIAKNVEMGEGPLGECEVSVPVVKQAADNSDNYKDEGNDVKESDSDDSEGLWDNGGDVPGQVNETAGTEQYIA